VRRFVPAVVLVLLASSACGDGGRPAPLGAVRPDGTLAWRTCEDGLECADLVRDGGSLPVMRLRAGSRDERIGVLVVHPGGPGRPATDLVRTATESYSAELLRRFDVVAFDNRGVGESCDLDLDLVFSPEPTEPPGSVARCVASETWNGRIGTVDAIDDVEALRVALGEDQLTLFGYSYGSELFLRYASRHPAQVRALVADGIIDVTIPLDERRDDQVLAFERAFTTYLDSPADIDRRELVAALPLPLARDGRPDLDLDLALTAIVQAMYSEEFWPALDAALVDAADGEPERLGAIADTYLGRQRDGSWDAQVSAYYAISCTDGARSIDPPTDEGWLVEFLARDWSICDDAALRTDEAPWDGWVPDGPPALVVATTGDPATPYEHGRSVALAIDATLLTFDARRHGAYPASGCVRDAVDAFLLDPSGRLDRTC
jgi:pimeloyl-ACP methyl ester carboxylesterase